MFEIFKKKLKIMFLSRTIVYLSIVYIIGHIFGTLGAIPSECLGIVGATEL